VCLIFHIIHRYTQKLLQLSATGLISHYASTSILVCVFAICKFYLHIYTTQTNYFIRCTESCCMVFLVVHACVVSVSNVYSCCVYVGFYYRSLV